MKISIIVSNPLKKDPRVIKQVKVAIQAGHEVQFVGYRDAFYDKEFLENLGCRFDIVDFGEEYLGKLNSVAKKLKRRLGYPRAAQKYIEDFCPDVIHANDFDMLIPAYRAARKCKAAVVYDSHEVYAENIGIAEHNFVKKMIISIERRLVKKVDHMICVSNAAADYFKEKYKIRRPSVITNCPMRNSLPLKEKAEDAFEVVYQGLMVAGRGYEEFVQAAKLLPADIRLVLRGYGTLEPKLREMIAKENLEKKVHFVQPVEVSELISAASSSHVGIVVTRPVNLNFRLSISNKVFEYAAAGLPVILSDVPEHRYLNDKYHFGLILEEVTPECIAKGILYFKEHPEEYKTMAQNALRMFEELNWEQESQKLLQIYADVCKKG